MVNIDLFLCKDKYLPGFSIELNHEMYIKSNVLYIEGKFSTHSFSVTLCHSCPFIRISNDLKTTDILQPPKVSNVQMNASIWHLNLTL